MQDTQPFPSPDTPVSPDDPPPHHRTGVALFQWLAFGLVALTLLLVALGVVLAMLPGPLGES